MSIRFRLTLLYSTILALTLIIFGVALYSIQAKDTLNSLEHDLLMSSEKFSDTTFKTDNLHPPQDAPDHQDSGQPRPFDEFSSDQAFLTLKEREIVRILDPEGSLVASPSGRVEDALPLSDEGLAALQGQQDWWENANVAGEDMLIYSRPVIQDGETIYIVQVARSLTERNRTLKSLATTLVGAGVITILAAFGAGWALSGYSLKPIDRITQTAKAIGEESDFTRRVSYTGPPDEVGRLASTFNQMLGGLQEAYQKVEHALQMQRNFVADVSHELRTPLTTLRGNLGLLRRDPPTPPEEQADILSDMVEESDRLIRLVNDLLLMARADAGRSLAREALEIRPLLEECVRQARQLDQQRKISLDVTGESNMLGDRDALKQVMLILLDNALKHSDGAIQVKAVLNNRQAELRVQDFGPGIPPDKLDHVFDRFYRGEETSITPGFGLGLPIAKSLVEGMNGTINIESKPGIGSILILRFAAVKK